MPALLDVLGGVHERTLGQPDAAGGHDRPHGVEPEHGQTEPTDLADHVFGGDMHLVENELAGVIPRGPPSCGRSGPPTPRPSPSRR